jgi:hypothetical protein
MLSKRHQTRVAMAPAVLVARKALQATLLAAKAEPALNPNQPNHKRPVPVMTMVMLCGTMVSFPYPRRMPRRRAKARAEKPALM